MAKNPYSFAALSAIAEEDLKYLRAIKGKNKKCLVLDCDNTLWGGIGEDGMDGIKLGSTYPGSAFIEFQKEILNLYNRGIIVALCSKDIEHDEPNLLNHHSNILLKNKHIAAKQTNWGDKATNLRRIAEILNIGLDSFVICDDSDFEIGLINNELPQVATVHMQKDKVVQFGNIIASCGLFDMLNSLSKDRTHGAMYKAESERKILKTTLTDIKDYNKSLEMKVTIGLAGSYHVLWISQQSLKTNQFNLTTRRYSDADVTNFANSAEHDVVYLSLKDRFGDSGLVGTCIINYYQDEARIDTLLLSCRVLGRRVEDVFVSQILEMAAKHGMKTVRGEYIPSRSNAQVENFYENQGFSRSEISASSGSLFFVYDLSKGIPSIPYFLN